MNSLKLAPLLAVTLTLSSHGQDARFFRISGPVATTISALGADGTVTWTNALTNATFTVQTALSVLGPSNWVDYVQVPVTNPVTTLRLYDPNPPSGMALIPAGSFTIGDTLDGESDAIPTNVYVSAFYMDTNLVSSNQWDGVYSYATTHGYSFAHPGAGKAANHPVQTVDWYDCVKWSNARSAQAGLTPVYYTDAGFTQVFTYGDRGTTVYPNWAANGYRLPTEAEWEKASRGGLSTQRFPWGDTISESQANYFAKPDSYSYDLGPYGGYNTNFDVGGDPYTSPVGYFAANGYGLNDMTGNLSEWCWDWYAVPPYPAGSPYLGGTDPRGPIGPLSQRVLRGGRWDYYAVVARCAYRCSYGPYFAVNLWGFRCVRGF